jgi:predicted PurR-regulated permease PerM
MSENKNTLDISWGSIVKMICALVVLYFLYQIVDILVWFVFALIISILFNPIVNFLKKLRIPRVLGVVFVYFGFFGLVSLLIYIAIPGLYSEVKNFSTLLPDYIKKVSPFLQYIGVEGFDTLDQMVESLRASSVEVTKNIFNTLVIIFGGISTAFFIITMAIFLSLEGNSIEKAIKLFASEKQKEQALLVWRKCRDQIGSWFLIRVLAGFFVAVVSFVVFYLLGANYALLFAIIGGLFNFIPYAGPAVAGLIFFLVTSLDSVVQATFVFIAFMIIQIIEGNILSPALSQKIMGVSPVLVLIALVVGGSLWGLLGAFLAIPLLGITFEFFKGYFGKKEEVAYEK